MYKGCRVSAFLLGAFLSCLTSTAFLVAPGLRTGVVSQQLFHPSRQKFLQLCTSSTSIADLRDRLCLYDRFGRWRYLQRLLDEEADALDLHKILFAVLDGYLKYPRPKFQGSDETGSPELTENLRCRIQDVLAISTDATAIATTTDNDDDDSEITNFLTKLEKLLPDPNEEEDSYRSLWDIVMDLHGREMVKINERNGRSQWKRVCLIARILLHYDFLIYGLVDRPLE